MAKEAKKSSRKIREGAEKVNKILHASKQLNRIFKVAQKGQQNIFLLAYLLGYMKWEAKDR